MNAIHTVVKLHTRDRLMWFIAPWIFELAAFLISLLVGLLRERYGSGFSSGEAGNIYAFYFVLGILSVNDTFPFALGFGVRRRDYFLGTLLLVAVLSAVIALALVTLVLLENHVVNSLGMNLLFFAWPYPNAGSFPAQCWMDFSLLVNLFSLGFAIGSVYRRFGNVGLWTFLAVAFTLLTTWIGLNTYLNRWGALFAWLGQFSAFELALGLLSVTALYLLAAYLLLRRAVV